TIMVTRSSCGFGTTLRWDACPATTDRRDGCRVPRGKHCSTIRPLMPCVRVRHDYIALIHLPNSPALRAPPCEHPQAKPTTVRIRTRWLARRVGFDLTNLIRALWYIHPTCPSGMNPRPVR